MDDCTIWLTYDPDDGFEECMNEKDGRAALDSLLDSHTDMAADGVHEDVEQVALFRCVRVAGIRQTVTARAEDDTPDGEACRANGWDFMVDLSIEDQP